MHSENPIVIKEDFIKDGAILALCPFLFLAFSHGENRTLTLNLHYLHAYGDKSDFDILG